VTGTPSTEARIRQTTVAVQKKKKKGTSRLRSPQEGFDSKEPKDVLQKQQDLHLTVRPVV